MSFDQSTKCLIQQHDLKLSNQKSNKLRRLEKRLVMCLK